jgi:hypothetical protein
MMTRSRGWTGHSPESNSPGALVQESSSWDLGEAEEAKVKLAGGVEGWHSGGGGGRQ